MLKPYPTSPSSDGTVDDLAWCFRLSTKVCDLLKCRSLRAAVPIMPYVHDRPLQSLWQVEDCLPSSHAAWHGPARRSCQFATRLRPERVRRGRWPAIPNIVWVLLMLRLLLRDSPPRRALQQGANFASLYTTQLNRLASGVHQACERTENLELTINTD